MPPILILVRQSPLNIHNVSDLLMCNVLSRSPTLYRCQLTATLWYGGWVRAAPRSYRAGQPSSSPPCPPAPTRAPVKLRYTYSYLPTYRMSTALYFIGSGAVSKSAFCIKWNRSPEAVSLVPSHIAIWLIYCESIWFKSHKEKWSHMMDFFYFWT